MDGYQHYIRTDVNGIVIKGFTSAFPEIATPQPGDLELSGYETRGFQLELMTPPPRNQYKYKVVSGQMVERTQAELDAEINTVAKRRQDVLNKWDPQIDAQRETLRKLQDEDKPAAAITKAKTNIHNLVASKNAELAVVV